MKSMFAGIVFIAAASMSGARAEGGAPWCDHGAMADAAAATAHVRAAQAAFLECSGAVRDAVRTGRPFPAKTCTALTASGADIDAGRTCFDALKDRADLDEAHLAFVMEYDTADRFLDSFLAILRDEAVAMGGAADTLEAGLPAYVDVGGALITHLDRPARIAAPAETVAAAALVRSGGQTYRLADIVRIMNKKTVVCSARTLKKTGRVNYACRASVLFTDDGARVGAVVRWFPAPARANADEYVALYWLKSGDGAAALKTPAHAALARDPLIVPGGADADEILRAVADARPLPDLESALDAALAADKGRLQADYDRLSAALKPLD